jgi:glycine cleavage system H protein
VSSDVIETLRYSKDHCWARLDEGGLITIGLTDFARSALGAIVFAGLPAVGSDVELDEVLGEVESTKAVSELYAPVGGTVTAVNSELAETPGQINADPYGAGWICTIEPADPDAIGRLLDASAYASLTDIEPQDEPSTKD